LLQVGTDSA